MEIRPPARGYLHRAHQGAQVNQVDKPRGVGETSEERQNNSSHRQTAGK